MQMFVTLPVKPEQLDRYVALAKAEVAGAREEAGNSAFFAYFNGDDPNVMHLFEHWNSEAWLTVDHAAKPYYQEMRGVEPEVIDGDVGEAMLTEVAPLAPAPASAAPVGFAQATRFHDGEAACERTFGDEAAAVRESEGMLGLWLFRVTGTDEYLLIEHWESAEARAAAEHSTALFGQRGNDEIVIRLHDILVAS